MNKVIKQDCIEYLKTVPDKTFDLVIADPPYFRICGEFDFLWADVNQYIDWCRIWISEIHRTLKETGTFYLWGKIGFNNGYALFKLADWMENEKLFRVVNWITQKNTRGRGNKRGFMEAREELIFAVKSDSYTWNPNYTDEPNNRSDLGFDGKPRKNSHKRTSDVWTCFSEASQSRNQRFKTKKGESFPTVKSLDICSRIIQASSNEADLIYIPFGGSGSEAVAASTLKRQWILTEMEADYVTDIIVPRLAGVDFTLEIV